MKPASIIALIISVMLIVIGFSACLIAKNMALANGELLFSEKKEEGRALGSCGLKSPIGRESSERERR